MAIKTTRQQLEEVQAAIEQVLASQEMRSGSDRLRRPDLKTLYAREDVLKKRLEVEEDRSLPHINTGIMRRR